jgi:hypothetical protein
MENVSEKQIQPRRFSRIRTALGLFAAVLILVVGQVIFLKSEPTSHGMTVTEWLNDTNSQHYVWNTNFAVVAAGFGTNGAPYFNDALLDDKPAAKSLLARVQELLGLPMAMSNVPQMRRVRAFMSLISIGREHPDRIDPYFFAMLNTTNRGMAITAFGYFGDRHFAFLTNLITGTNGDEAVAAVSSLCNMGTNAQAAVPLILARIGDLMVFTDSYFPFSNVRKQIGLNHPDTLPVLIQLMEHPARRARQQSPYALAHMTNHHQEIAAAFVKLARKPMLNQHDPGEFVCSLLFDVGVSPDDAVPLLIHRLKRGIVNDGAAPEAQLTIRWLRNLHRYGIAAKPAIPIVERDLLSMPSRQINPDSPKELRLSPVQRDTIATIHGLLKSIDPTWTPASQNRP